jgi:lysine-N-methylase
MKLLVLEDTRFSCSACGKCCRNWHVELIPYDAERVQKIAWPAGDPLLTTKVVMIHGGRTYLAHAEDRACVFLNRQTNLCRIHAEFGEAAKPVGCLLYPYQIVPTFSGEATISPRYECPTTRKNIGAPHADALADLKRLAPKLEMSRPFDDDDCCNLDRDQVIAVSEFAAVMLHGFERNDQRSLFLIALVDFISSLNTDELDREALGNAFAQIKPAVEAITSSGVKKPGWLTRMVFRTYLGLNLRRDEDVLDKVAGRFQRLFAMAKFVFGFGGFNDLGIIHPHGKLRKARLFKLGIDVPDANVFELLWRVVTVKLMSQQYLGAVNQGRNLLSGLRSLALLYPLACAAAKYRAGNRGSSVIELEDVDYAVNVIEHNFGRNDVLALPFARSFEKMLVDPDTFVRVVRTI